MTAELLLIRHAETDLAGTFCGQLDPPLNLRGRQEAIELVQSLAGETMHAVYSSDLQRAFDVGAALAESKGLSCQPAAALREIYFGAWEGLDWKNIEKRDPEIAAVWLARFPRLSAPGGESFKAFEQRVSAEITYICAQAERTVAIVTHAGVIRMLLERLAKLNQEQTWERPLPFCSVLRLTRVGNSDSWSLSYE